MGWPENSLLGQFDAIALEAVDKTSGDTKLMKQPCHTWKHGGFEDFSNGLFENGGDNLYVNANGVIEMIHRLDINNDGYVDIILPNSHSYDERAPTWIYKQGCGDGKDWPRQELPNDSGWMSRIIDVDGDGYLDLIVINGENGVTSELNSYIYWGGPQGLTGERTDLPTAGAYDVAAVDINGDGLLDLIIPSAWVDHHNAGVPRHINVYEQVQPRKFVDTSERHGLIGIAAVSAACADLTGNGRPDLVVANFRKEFDYEIESFVYWGTENGFDAGSPLCLPTHFAVQTVLGDLNSDGYKEIIFCGGGQVRIYWNDRGTFSVDNRTIIETPGNSMIFSKEAIRAEVADVDGDGKNELILATLNGIQVRHTSDLQTVQAHLDLKYSSWVCAADLDGDGRPELIASRYHDEVLFDTTSAVFWNGPNGFSNERVTWVPTAGAMGCTAGDLDGDGRPEVVFNGTLRGYSHYADTFPVYIYLGSKDHDYGPHRRLELPSLRENICYVLADIDLDGYADLVVAGATGLRIFPGGPDGPKPGRYIDLPKRAPSNDPYSSWPMQVFVADLDRDGHLDLLMSMQTYDDKPETMANSSVIFHGSAEGFSPDRSEVLPTFGYGQMHLADLNRNGYLDILYSDKRGYVGVFLGGPDGYSADRMMKIPVEGAMLNNINTADINKDGWLDIVVGIPGHYLRKPAGFCILYGGPDGFSPERSEYHLGNISPGSIAIADLTKDGYPDLLVSAYSTEDSRICPAMLYRGNGKSFDFENPMVVPSEAAHSFMPVDITGNGYPDLVVSCHRNDIGHRVDSLIMWNGPEGLSLDRVTRIAGLGPHYLTTRDPGNAYTREPWESYVSPPYDLQGRRPVRILWQAEVPERTELKFQLRWAESQAELEHVKWRGPDGEGSFFEIPGHRIEFADNRAAWLQYRAIFVSSDLCRSPKLREVCIDLK